MTIRLHRTSLVLFLLFMGALFLVLSGVIVLQRPEYSEQEPSPRRQESAQILSGSFDPDKQKTESEWKEILTPEQYFILRESGTEAPFTGALDNEKRSGTYYSVGCDTPLFRSEQKYNSGTGWPSFWAPIKEDAVVLRQESGFGDDRIEVLDPCGGHLGHIFPDGPEPTGDRYCMNSAALRFVPD